MQFARARVRIGCHGAVPPNWRLQGNAVPLRDVVGSSVNVLGILSGRSLRQRYITKSGTTLVRARSLPNWRISPERKSTLLGPAVWREAVRPCSPDERCVPLLTRRKFRRPAHVHTTGFCPCSTFGRPSSDQLVLKLDKPTEHSHNRVSTRCRRSRPGVDQGPEARTMIGDRSQDIQQVLRRSRTCPRM
jgi:hypothetical protein